MEEEFRQVHQEGEGVQVSELKAETIVPQGTTVTLQMYPKAETDKVIAELENRIDEGDKEFDIANEQNERLLKIVRHQKYKRCLDKANYWVAISYHCVDDKHRQRAERHHRK